ncbi:MAG: hypothetical protein A2X58_00430 [Nitrospirae bacterium GWC2_56_14]|nr:MAG: hypothetical protein A2X58_00430 [Nitrospirae bacterium GWC2_56_14]
MSGSKPGTILSNISICCYPLEFQTIFFTRFFSNNGIAVAYHPDMHGDRLQGGNNEIAREILVYLADHPEAGDTLEGIMQWWLLQRRIQNQIVLVEKALNELVNDGYVKKNINANVEVRYSIKDLKKSGEL